MRDLGMLQRMTDLERRVTRIESRLHLEDAPAAEVDPTAEPEPTVPVPPPPPVSEPVMPLPVTAAVTSTKSMPTASALTTARVPSRAADGAPPAALAYAARTIKPVAPVEQGAIERAIGLKWAGWVGAVVLVIGAGLGINLAWESGWFAYFPPAARLLLMSAGALGLIAAGELVYRRVHRVSAAGLFGAGVASLYLVAYAGHAYYELYGRSAAFAMMILATLIGSAVAMRGRLVSIAALALIGGGLAPLVLKGEQALAPLLFYLLMLQGIALLLAWWGASPKWWALRGLALGILWMWLGTTLPALDAATRAGWPLWFVPLYAALFQLELICSATRGGMRDGARDHAKSLLDDHLSGAVAWSLLITATLTATLLFLLHHSSDAVRGGWMLALAAATVILGLILSRNTQDPRYPLAVSFRAQAGILLILAVPTLFSGLLVTVGWSLLALAFAAAGLWMNLKLSRWLAVATWLAAIGHLALWSVHPVDAFNPREVALTISGVAVPVYLVAAWALAVVGHVIGWMTDAGDRTGSRAGAAGSSGALTSAAVGGALWLIASIAALPTLGATAAILAYAWLLLAADVLTSRSAFHLQSAAAIAAAVVKWMVVDSLAQRLAPGWQPMSAAPIFNATMAMGLAIAASMGALYVLRRSKWDALLATPLEEGADAAGGTSPTPLLVIAAALIGLTTFALTLELDHVVERAVAAAGALLWPAVQVKLMGWNMLWTVALAALGLAVMRLAAPPSRQRFMHPLAVGMVLLAAKYLLIDTLPFRLEGPPLRSVPFLFNLAGLDAVIVMAGLLGAWAAVGPVRLRGTIGLLILLVLLWTGTLEIERALAGTARHVGISIFWSAFAIGAVVAGFRFRVAPLRYFGLALFALTLMKVVAVDMAEARTGYRVLSFMGLGLLLLGTSVVYGKLSPKLLRAPGT